MKLKNKHILILILLVAAFLRFYNLFNIPFTHDEFSALFRLDFDNIYDVIMYGARIDGHPAGIHVFLYYWINWFGAEEWVVKLPFILFGIASVWLIYKVSVLWKGETMGLFIAAILAVSQFTVMYSQIARPYISGLFFSLVMMFFWSKLMLKPERKSNLNLAGFILGASLCTYNHHFSMLFAAIVGVVGVFYIKKEYLLRYLVAGLIVFILYIPHLEILFFQLQKGGVEGWLAKPEYDFLWNFIRYVLNYSWVLLVIVFSIIIYGLFYKRKFSSNKYIVFSTLFFLPLLIGFFYSKYVNAVLQFSVLIFSAPYLFFILFGHLKEFNVKKNTIVVSLILVTGTLSLVFGRKHYTIFYKDHFKYSLVDLHHAREEMDNKNLPGIIEVRKDILRYYSEKEHLDTNFRWLTSFSSRDKLLQYIKDKSRTSDYFYLGASSATDPVIVPIIQHYFPKIVWQKDYFIGTNYLFSKVENESSKKNNHLISHIDFKGKETSIGWSHFSKEFIHKGCFQVDSTLQWVPGFVMKTDNLVNEKNDFIDIKFTYQCDQPLHNVLLVTEVVLDDETVHWNGVPFSDFYAKSSSAGKAHVFSSIKLSDISGAMSSTVKIYVWNKGGNEFSICDAKIYHRTGNPIIYGLFNDF